MATDSNVPANASSGGSGGLQVVTEQLVPSRDPYGGPSGRYPAGAPADLPDLATVIREYWRIFNKRKWLVLSIMGVITVLGATWTLMMTPLYSSTVRLQIDRSASKVVEGGNVNPTEGGDTDFLRTQYELLQSRSLAERVTVLANLTEDPDFLKPRGFSILSSFKAVFGSKSDKPLDKAGEKRAAAEMIVKSVAVRPVPGSRLVDITYSDPSPARAQKVTASYADAFIASTLDKRFEANAYAKTFLEDQIKQLKLRLEDSEKVLINFAEKEQIVAVNEKSSIADNNLAAANAALGTLIGERIKNEQLWKQVEPANAMNVPQVLTNGVIDGLRTKKNELTREYQEKLETFKPSYPAMVQISNKIAEIDRQLATELKTIRGSLKAAYESSLNQENELKARIDTLKGEALDLQKRSIQYNILKREVDTNRELYNGLLQRFKEVDVAGGVGANNVFIVDRPEVAGSPSSPNILRSLMLSLILGLGAGLAAAYVAESFDDIIVTVEEVEAITGLATLGVIPRSAKDVAPEVELDDPRSALSEAYRSLCTSLQFTTERGLPKSLLITSAGPGEGKSMTSLAIARHFARMGLKVLVVDADLRKPSLHKKLNADNSIGLSNYLSGACAPPDAIQKTDVANLAFLSSGPLPPNAADLLSGSRFVSLLSLGLEVFDLIVIDAPPVLGLADVPLLANAAEASIFAVAAGQSRKGMLAGALKRLSLGKGPIIGTVVTKFDAKRAGYGYGYGYGAYNYGDAIPSPPAQPSLPGNAKAIGA